MNLKKQVAVVLAAASVAGLLGPMTVRAETLKVGDELGPQDPRSDLDHRLHPARLRLHGLGHAVRDGREARRSSPQMVDKWDVSPDKLTWTFTLRDGLVWSDGQPVTSEDCIAVDQALGRPRFDGPEDDGLGRGLRGGRRQDLQDEDEGAVRPGAGVARQAVVQRALHDAEEDRRDRPVHADQGRGRDRLRPVHLHRQGVEAGREGRVRQEPELQAARRAALGPGRRQGRQVRPRRMDLDPRRADPGGGPAERRGRHDRTARATTCCRCWPRTRTSSCSTPIRSATSTPCASTRCSSRSTTPRSATPRWSPSTRRTSSRPRSAIRNTTRSARRCSSAARRWPATRAWPTC